MILVQEPIESLALPVQADVDPCPERTGDPGQDFDRHASAESELDPGDHGLAHARRRGEVDLVPAAAQAERADPAAEANHVHRDIVATGAYAAIIRLAGSSYRDRLSRSAVLALDEGEPQRRIGRSGGGRRFGGALQSVPARAPGVAPAMCESVPLADIGRRGEAARLPQR